MFSSSFCIVVALQFQLKFFDINKKWSLSQWLKPFLNKYMVNLVYCFIVRQSPCSLLNLCAGESCAAYYYTLWKNKRYDSQPIAVATFMHVFFPIVCWNWVSFPYMAFKSPDITSITFSSVLSYILSRSSWKASLLLSVLQLVRVRHV